MYGANKPLMFAAFGRPIRKGEAPLRIGLCTALERMSPHPSMAAFIMKNSSILESSISRYLAGHLSPKEIQRTVDEIFAEWESSKLNESVETTDENIFWCALWAAQHLCSPSHEGTSAQNELLLLTRALRGEERLLPTYFGHRP